MIAALLTALAAALLIGPPPEVRLTALNRPPRRHRDRRLPLPPLASALAALAAAAAFPGAALWLLAAGIVGGTVWFLIRGHLRRRHETVAARTCARAARVLSSLLQAGQIPTAALADAATDCPVLAPAAAAARLGGDIAGELDRCSRAPGHHALAAISTAWRISERTGAPIADILARIADNLRREQQLGAVVEAELAAARASGQIMAVLPFLAVGLGFAVGVNPISFLTGELLGQVLLVVGVALTAAGVLWIEALARRSPR